MTMENTQQKLQSQLDSQADALEQGDDDRSRKARRGILQCLIDFRAILQENARRYDKDCQQLQEVIDNSVENAQRVDDLHNRIKSVDESGVGDAVKTATRSLEDLDERIHMLELELSQLKESRKESVQQLEHAQSRLESRCAVFQRELEEVETSEQQTLQSVRDASRRINPRGNLSRLIDESVKNGDSTATQLDICRHSLLAYREEQEKAEKEITAIDDGVVVWVDCINLLNELATNLYSIPTNDADLSASTMVNRDERVKKHLSDTIDRLDIHLKLAESKNWELLKVAIGQEVVTLQKARTMVDDFLAH